MRTEERKAIKACVFQTEKIQIKKMFWSWNEDSLKGRIKKKKKPEPSKTNYGKFNKIKT